MFNMTFAKTRNKRRGYKSDVQSSKSQKVGKEQRSLPARKKPAGQSHAGSITKGKR
jgi:hypothetical protein